MLVISHRGRTQSAAPDNTLEAFALAVSNSVDGVETDIRSTSDNQLVLYHDRFTPCGQPVNLTTLPELKLITHGTIATLHEAINAWPDILWNFELKDHSAFPLFINAMKDATRVSMIITSFFHGLALEASKTLSAPCGFLLAHRPVNVTTGIKNIVEENNARPDFLVWDIDFVDEELLYTVQKSKRKNILYNVTDYDMPWARSTNLVHACIVDHLTIMENGEEQHEEFQAQT